jgi:predicted MFS family arabinose efflux permease
VLGILQTFTLDGVFTFLSDYLHQTLDISVGNVGMLVALSMVVRILGAATNSRLTDRIGHKQSLFVAIGLAFVACVGLALFGAVPLIGLFGFAFLGWPMAIMRRSMRQWRWTLAILTSRRRCLPSL